MLYVMPVLFALRKWKCNIIVILILGISAFCFLDYFHIIAQWRIRRMDGWNMIAPLWTRRLFNVHGICNAFCFSFNKSCCSEQACSFFSHSILTILFVLGIIGTMFENCNALSF